MLLFSWLLVACGPPPPTDEELVQAARTGDVATVERALASGASHHDALLAAVEAGQLETARLLLVGTPADTVENAWAYNPIPRPLTLAMVRLLLEHGAVGGRFLLPNAIRTGDIEAARVVLDHLQTRSLSDTERQVFLFEAVTSVGAERLDLTQLLLARGAEPGIVALHAARQGRTDHLLAALDAGESLGAAYYHVLAPDCPERAPLLRALLERGPPPDGALVMAAEVGDESAVALLVDYGATDVARAIAKARNKGHEALAARLEQRRP